MKSTAPESINWEELRDDWAPFIGTAAVASMVTLGGVVAYTRFFKRYPTSEAVPVKVLARRGWIKGVVTSVGDADNFRLYHTPGPSTLWRFRSIPATTKELQNQTIHIRLAGADAPEAAHFGRPKQPYSEEALTWLKSVVEGRRVYCQLTHRDQYGRIVANVHTSPRILPASLFTGKNVSYEMVRAGWGATYLQSGAEYGKIGKDGFLAMEAQAKAARRGMWEKGTKGETPAEYKKRIRSGDMEAQSLSDSAPRRSFLSRFLPWRK